MNEGWLFSETSVSQSTERRNFVRIYESLPAKVMLVSPDGASTPDSVQYCLATNISIGGAKIDSLHISEEDIQGLSERRKRLFIELNLGRRFGRFHAIATVRWAKRTTADSVSVGLKFEEVTDRDIETLKRFVINTLLWEMDTYGQKRARRARRQLTSAILYLLIAAVGVITMLILLRHL